MPIAIAADRASIAASCRAHHIRKLSLFGSVIRPDFRSESDVDVLVEFESGYVPGLAFFAMEDDLGQILRRRVDLNTPDFLSPELRERMVAEAEVLYVKG